MDNDYKIFEDDHHKPRFEFIDESMDEILNDNELSYEEQIEQFDNKAIIHEFRVYGNSGDLSKMKLIFTGLVGLLKSKEIIFIEEFFNLGLHKVIFDYGLRSEDEMLRLTAIVAINLFLSKDPNCLPYFIECDILGFISSVLHLPFRKEATESLILLCQICKLDELYLDDLFDIFPIRRMRKMIYHVPPKGADILKYLSHKPKFLQILGSLLSIVIESGKTEPEVIEIATLVYNANFDINNYIFCDKVRYLENEISLRVAFQGYMCLAVAKKTIPDNIYPEKISEYFEILSSMNKPTDESVVIYGCIGALPFIEYKLLDLYDFRSIIDISHAHRHDAAGRYALNCLLRYLQQDETGEIIENFILSNGFEFLLDLAQDCNFSSFEKANEIFTFIVNYPEIAAEDLLNDTCKAILANSITLSDENIIKSVLQSVHIIGIRSKNQNMIDGFIEFINDIELEQYVEDNIESENEEISELANKLNDFLNENCS